MDALRLATAGAAPATEAQRNRARAERTAGQFEELFVRTMVQSLRSSSSLGGEEGGMFGSGPGADTYADWFDQNMSEQIARTSEIGIKRTLLADLERHGQIEAAATAATTARRVADRSALHATTTPATGGVDVLLR